MQVNEYDIHPRMRVQNARVRVYRDLHVIRDDDDDDDDVTVGLSPSVVHCVCPLVYNYIHVCRVIDCVPRVYV